MTAGYDVVIVGSGAGGGTLARELGASGASILIIERGGWLPREPENWSPAAVFQEDRYVSPDPWRTSSGLPFAPQAHYYVGGSTKLYGAALFRLRPSDFADRSFADGDRPAWPVTYDDMEPWYTQAEHLYRVHGRHGEDPTEGHCSADYPYDPVPHERRIADLAVHFERQGLHPFHAPSAVDVGEGGDCVLCQFCDGHPCPLLAKCDAAEIAVRPALAMYPNVRLRTGTEVLYVTMNGGAASGVMVKGVHGVEMIRACHVVLAAGALNTAILMQRSIVADELPAIGANYMCHNSRAVLAVSTEPNPTRFQKTLAVNDYYEEGLGGIQMLGKSTGTAMRGESRLARLLPGWSASKIARHSLDFWLTTEDLPKSTSRVRIDPDGTPVLEYTPTNRKLSDALYSALTDHLGSRYLTHGMNVPLSATAHQAGTCRMGTDPADSVVNASCQVWGHDGLWIADASFMPSVGAVNPALTVMANALRVAALLRAEL